MSVHIVSQVWSLSLPPVQKLVLLKMADCANDEGGNAFPSVARVAAECGVSDRTVQRTLRELEAAGYIAVSRREADHRPRCYAVKIERGDKLSGRQSRQSGVTLTTERGDTAMSPDPSCDPSIDPSEVSKPAARAKTSKDDPTDEAFVFEAVAQFGDALGGEAEVRREIESALNHTASKKAINKRRYVLAWLSRAVKFRAERAATPRPLSQPRGRPERPVRQGGFDYAAALRERVEATG